MRSRTGCHTCRARKLKCDEVKPVCGQCIKAKRNCIVNTELLFRHQQNASLNSTDDPESSKLNKYYNYKQSFGVDVVWVDVPKIIRFINITDPYAEQEEIEKSLDVFESPPLTHVHLRQSIEDIPIADYDAELPALEVLADAAVSEQLHQQEIFALFDPAASNPSSPLEFGKILTNSEVSTDEATPHTPAPSHNHNQTPEQVGTSSPFFPISAGSGLVETPPISCNSRRSHDDYSYQSSPSTATLKPFSASPSALSRHSSIETDQEMVYLLRYFAEHPGDWMDLYDMDRHFSYYVPTNAQSSSLIKYAAVACAAKARGRVEGKLLKSRSLSHFGIQNDRTSEASWYAIAAEYYHHAVSMLRLALVQEQVQIPFTPPLEKERQEGSSTEYVSRRERTVDQPRSENGIDDLLTATAILCAYEFLDTSGSNWSRHLAGAKGLIDAGRSIQSKARRAAFWNIVRQDMIAAFINLTRTRYDPEDREVWQNTGLQFDDKGHPQVDSCREDMISNSLIWLLCKLVNYLADGDYVYPVMGPQMHGVPQKTLLEYWHYLKGLFDDWYRDLPATFKPLGKFSSSQQENNSGMPGSTPSENQDAHSPIEATWYTIPLVASTMQWYHMSQILLHANKPQISTHQCTLHGRLRSYTDTIRTCSLHAKAIMSIALSKASDSSRIHAVQPLFVAGQCLKDSSDRQLALKLLNDIQQETGWATDYRVSELESMWANDP